MTPLSPSCPPSCSGAHAAPAPGASRIIFSPPRRGLRGRAARRMVHRHRRPRLVVCPDLSAALAAPPMTETAARAASPPAAPTQQATAVLVFADGSAIRRGAASARPAARSASSAFNTAMTGFQEVLTDPSYAGQIIAFTFPHNRQCRGQRRGPRGGAAGGAGLRVARRRRRAVELAGDGAARRLAEGAGRAGDGRGRYPALTRRVAPPAPPRRSSPTIPAGAVRHRGARRRGRRLAGARGHGSGPRSHLRSRSRVDADRLDPGAAVTAPSPRRGAMRSPSITAPSATSCAASPTAGCRVTVVPRHRLGGRDSALRARTGCTFPTVPATPRPPASTLSRPFARCWKRGFRSSAFASAARCWRLAAGARTVKMRQGQPRRPTIRSRTSPPARWKSPARTTVSVIDRDSLPPGGRAHPSVAVRRERWRESRSPESPPSGCNITPKRRPAPATATICSTAFPPSWTVETRRPCPSGPTSSRYSSSAPGRSSSARRASSTIRAPRRARRCARKATGWCW